MWIIFINGDVILSNMFFRVWNFLKYKIKKFEIV